MFIALISEDDYFKSKKCSSSAAIAQPKGAIKRLQFLRSTVFYSYNNIFNT